jgi:hypothetical protein
MLDNPTAGMLNYRTTSNCGLEELMGEDNRRWEAKDELGRILMEEAIRNLCC